MRIAAERKTPPPELFSKMPFPDQPTPHIYHPPKHIPNLDGLRGIAILLVLIHHVPPFASPLLRTLQINASSGVTLFFVLSGFLICTLALKEVRETGSFSLWNFYIRRTLRLFPLYYTTLAVVCLLVFIFGVYSPEREKIFAERLPSYLFYFSNIQIIDGPYSLLWSLAVEEQFYLLFSTLFFFCRKKIAGIAFLLFFLLQIQPFVSYHSDNMILSTIGRIFSFFEPIFLGVFLAYAFDNARLFQAFKKFFNHTAVLSVIVVGILIYLFGDHPTNIHHGYNLLLALLVGISVLSPPYPFIGGALMSHIGKISYGIYLTHTIIFYGIKELLGFEHPFWTLILGTIVVVGLSTFIYNHFETYFLAYKEKFLWSKDAS